MMSDTYPDNLEEKYDDLVEKLMAKQAQLDEAVEALEEITNIVQEHGEAVTIWDVVSIAQEALSEIGGDCDE